MTVSVIIPTYNRSSTIGRAIASVTDAGLPAYEIIVIDDGSTDDTERVVRSLPWPVRYVHQPNRGAAAARNRGIEESRGRYLLFLDSDDRLLPGGHAALIPYLDAHPDVAVGFPQCRVLRQSGPVQQGYHPADTLWRVPHMVTAEGLVVFEQQGFLRGLLLDRCFVHISSAVRKDAVREAGGFNADFRGYEEWDFYARLAARFQFAYTPITGLEIEKHDSNMSGDVEAMMGQGVRILDSFLAGSVPVSPHDRPAVQQKLEGMSIASAYAAFARADHKTARRRFMDHMRRFGLSGRALLYFAASCLPVRPVSMLRGWKSSWMLNKGTSG